MHRLKLTFAALLCLTASWVTAHEVRPAYLEISESEITDAYDVLWKQPIMQDRRLPIDPVFPSDCSVEDRAAPEVTAAALIYRWRVTCALLDGVIEIGGLTVTLTDVMVRVNRKEGSSETYILRPENPRLDLSSATPPALGYLMIGIEHLVFGIDHVLFVVGLFLFIRDPWTLLKTITAFTVAHSITLALSVMNLVRLDQGPIEAIIALSIVFLARELLQAQDKRSVLTNLSPWIMAFVFGLLHGLGFAGALADIGLPEDTLWIALLLFNVGLEIGQIIVIALMALLVWLLQRLGQAQRFTTWAAYGMGCIAAFWTIDRTLLLL